MNTWADAAIKPVKTKKSKKRACPIASSMLFPKIQRNHMFPIRWNQLPWENIEVNMLAHPSPSTRHGPCPVDIPVSSAGMAPTLSAGLQILARPYQKGVIFRLAYAYEQGTAHRRPPDGFPTLLLPQK